MSDQADAGSVAETPAGAPATPTPSAENGSAAQGPENPFSGLQDEGARKWVETKGYKTLADVVGAAHSLEQRLGTAVTIPAADAPKEEWDKFVSKLPEDRRPIASPDQIEFKRPEGLPENLPYNDELAAAARPWMAEAGLTKAQAQTVHDKFAGWMAEQATAQQALGSLDRITKTVKVLGMVNSAPGFESHPKVINGCSGLLVEVLGDAGRHTRSAVGFAALPNSICVEIEATFEVE